MSLEPDLGNASVGNGVREKTTCHRSAERVFYGRSFYVEKAGFEGDAVPFYSALG